MRKVQKHTISPVGDILNYLIRKYALKLGVTQDTFARNSLSIQGLPLRLSTRGSLVAIGQ